MAQSDKAKRRKQRQTVLKIVRLLAKMGLVKTTKLNGYIEAN